ncbi:hypothetical protein DDE20_00775 [Pararhodobacter oceanensis]|uniref:Uncharacterized protein n=1 Tax=Pararhodobacter oceanensis TaxID=2172121 RepID=A0A2T8HXI2_9RHOB|nr:hypothetical protein DDE20_00775 [Pararhodobacter oceanensis]
MAGVVRMASLEHVAGKADEARVQADALRERNARLRGVQCDCARVSLQPHTQSKARRAAPDPGWALVYLKQSGPLKITDLGRAEKVIAKAPSRGEGRARPVVPTGLRGFGGA